MNESLSSLFAELAPTIEATGLVGDFFERGQLLDRLAALRLDFRRDVQRIGRDLRSAADEPREAPDRPVSEILRRWEVEGGGPTLTAQVAHAIERFSLPPADPRVKAAFLSAILGEYPNDLPYHGNTHYRHVLFHGLRLIEEHGRLWGGTARDLGSGRVALLLTACCVHDLGHAGEGNVRDGTYVPGLLELRSVALCRPFLERLGVPADWMGQLETMVYCTDITHRAGGESPGALLRVFYERRAGGESLADLPCPLTGPLSRLAADPGLGEAAMLLCEADVATSAAVSYDRTVRETAALMAERGRQEVGPGAVLAFLREQLGGAFHTGAGRRLYGRGLERVLAQSERQLERDRSRRQSTRE